MEEKMKREEYFLGTDIKTGGMGSIRKRRFLYCLH